MATPDTMRLESSGGKEPTLSRSERQQSSGLSAAIGKPHAVERCVKPPKRRSRERNSRIAPSNAALSKSGQ
ncbi:hypothetical protein HYPDE_28998 [Hyphomicrobium denitrificans 1NES1]|uniref:Uncharacterized protein n=1 Tax=Hyphomicrobium denitrificans 1NES1 TaxID=670307 RepID=N0B3C5_9HYPH|nr:hypothetical protein HYPDE_28998 [Hyphomicrobium denitrificans 1NES1]